MAFSARRSLATGLSSHLTRRLHPSLSHLLPSSHHDNNHENPSSSSVPPFPTQQPPHFPSGDLRRRARSQGLALPLPFGAHLAAHRGFSTSGSSPGPQIDGILTDPAVGQMDVAAGVLSDAAASVAPAFPLPFPGEVAAAAADSFPPVAALQYLIDAVHSFTGLNWWASIAVTTILIRTVTIPLLVNQLKSTMKLNAIRPEIEAINMEMQNSMDPQSMLEGKKKLGELFTKSGVNPLTPLKGLFIQGPIFMSFFFAIQNMVEKVPSLKGGGAYWFTDLTTPDELYILPVLTSATFLATVELNMQEGMEGNPMLQTMKKFSRILALMTIPFTMHFPKAIFCYWVTANLFSLGYGFALRKTAVRYFLNLPEIVPQPAPAEVSTFNLFKAPKPVSAVNTPTGDNGDSSTVVNSDSTTAVNGSEQSNAELSDRVVFLEKKIAELERRAKARGESQEE
ncbi:hypothetical protein ZWY2020_035532 [Hordeum vulgare]|nr:hypothetical protein ZWY2020_035532 [Hordeum vulgare]